MASREDMETPEHIADDFEYACTVDEVPEFMPRKVQVADRGVLVCRKDGAIHAVDEICPHKNQSMERAPVINGEIICPHHRYRFNLETGRCNQRCAPVQVYEVAVADDQVWIRP